MLTSAEIAQTVGGVLHGKADKKILSLKVIDQSDSSSVTFISDKKFIPYLSECKAGVLLVNNVLLSGYAGDYILVDDPYLAFAQVSALFDPEPKVAVDIHRTAVIEESVTLGENVTIGANAVIGKGVVLENGSSIGPNVTIGDQCVIGENCIIYPGVILYHQVVVGKNCRIHAGTVIGSHGFGYASSQDKWHKIAQIGRVIIGNDVEIAANCAIDRGTIQDTIIEDGVKIDNLVHIAHNVVVGEHSALAGQIGISGSTQIGHHTLAGGQAGFAGHIKTAPRSVFTGQAMITGNVNKPGVYSSGIGYLPSKDWRKMVARLRRLDELSKKITVLEQKAKQNI